MNRRLFLSVSGLAAVGTPGFRPLPVEAAQGRWQPDGAATLARLGVLTPEFDPVPESEMSAMAPPGVSIHAARVRRNTAAAFAEPPYIDNAAGQLADLAPKAVAFAYTSSSYALGAAAEGPLRARLEQRVRGIPVVLTCSAAVEALRALGVTRVALIHPPWFSDDINARGREYFRAQGFEVLRCEQIAPARTFTEVRPEEVFEWVRGHVPRDAQAVFIGGNGLRAVGVIKALEAALDRPVLTANQVVFWAALQTAKVSVKVPDYGRLFATG